MKLSATEIVSDGITRDYSFSFVGEDKGYLRNSDVEVTVERNPVAFTLTSTNSLTLDVAPEAGKVILIRRVMPKDRTYADFRKGNNFREQVINNSFLQTLYTIHELLDGYFSGKVEFQDEVILLNKLTAKGDSEFLGDVSIEGILTVLGSAIIAGVVEADSDPENPKSLVNFEKADTRYLDFTKDEVARLEGEDAKIVRNYQSADAAILAQILGEEPLAASAFSPISWHDQTISVSLNIPPNKNAWSFGPSVTIAEGQSIAIGDGSYWTIANGEGETISLTYDGGEL